MRICLRIPLNLMKKYLIHTSAAVLVFLSSMTLRPLSSVQEIFPPEAGVTKLPPIQAEQHFALPAPLAVAADSGKERKTETLETNAKAQFPQTAPGIKTPDAESGYPVRLIIPSIKLNAPIRGIGINTEGEMDVPSGHTKNVGWYQDGTIPGALGSAVLDAHVFAAFSKLKYVKPGSDIFILNQDGARLHFVVLEAATYPIADVPLFDLFHKSDMARLNLITCSGKRTSDGSTYDHRLVVYAALVQTLSANL